MKFLIIALLSLMLVPSVGTASDNKLNPFESDGCSMVPDSEPFTGNDWLNCCTPHDYNYWKGGTEAEKDKTDLEFKACLERNKMGQWLSRIFYYGVMAGGTPAVKTTWRWGYGWENTRDYKKLSKEELRQVEDYKNLTNLPVQIKMPQASRNILKAFTYRDNCEKDMHNKILRNMNFKGDPGKLKIHSVEGRGGDRYQVFSPECKGGYIIIDFIYSISPDVCGFSDYYYNQVERIRSFQVFGSCRDLMKN